MKNLNEKSRFIAQKAKISLVSPKHWDQPRQSKIPRFKDKRQASSSATKTGFNTEREMSHEKSDSIAL